MMKTCYAPAERATEEDVGRQVRSVLETENLENLYASVSDIVVVLNKERQVVFANKNLLDLIGETDLSRVYGRRPGEVLRCVHASETEAGCGTTESCSACGGMRAIMTAQKGAQDVQECRIIQDENSDALELLFKASPLSVNGEEFTVVAIKDISHEKRRRVLERIFFHDIMNTAVGVRGLSELLSIADSESLDQFRKMIYSGAEKLVDEIRSQRDLTAAENNELKTTIEVLDTGSVLANLVELYAAHEVAEGKALRLDEKSESFQMKSDKTLLTRVLGNMIKNALEACKPGDSVIVSVQRHNDSAEFRVHNPGHIPRDAQLQIFQRSFTTKGVGRGLGTYSMRLLSERYLHGHVSFTSSGEEGTTFIAVYPVAPDETRAQNAQSWDPAGVFSRPCFR